MRFFRVAVTCLATALLPGQAYAAAAGDFAGLPICSKLRAMPQGHRRIKCSARAPLKGDCRFSLSADGAAIQYLIEDGVVIDKRVDLRPGMRTPGPFGLRWGDRQAAAARKVLASTRLATRYWTSTEDEAEGYLQSTDVACGRNKSHAVYVWFRDGKAQAVSVSTLPAF